jgi:hypothetical protein
LSLREEEEEEEEEEVLELYELIRLVYRLDVDRGISHPLVLDKLYALQRAFAEQLSKALISDNQGVIAIDVQITGKQQGGHLMIPKDKGTEDEEEEEMDKFKEECVQEIGVFNNCLLRDSCASRDEFFSSLQSQRESTTRLSSSKLTIRKVKNFFGNDDIPQSLSRGSFSTSASTKAIHFFGDEAAPTKAQLSKWSASSFPQDSIVRVSDKKKSKTQEKKFCEAKARVLKTLGDPTEKISSLLISENEILQNWVAQSEYLGGNEPDIQAKNLFQLTNIQDQIQKLLTDSMHQTLPLLPNSETDLPSSLLEFIHHIRRTCARAPLAENMFESPTQENLNTESFLISLLPYGIMENLMRRKNRIQFFCSAKLESGRPGFQMSWIDESTCNVTRTMTVLSESIRQIDLQGLHFKFKLISQENFHFKFQSVTDKQRFESFIKPVRMN